MHILSFDDAALLTQLALNKELSSRDDMFCNVRKGTIHLVTSTQVPEVLSPGIVANCANKIVFRLDSGAGIEAMQRHMGITEPSQREYFYKLNQKEHEVIVEFARRSRPFVAKILNVNPPAKMSEQELRENNARIMQGFSPVIARSRGTEAPAVHVQEKSPNELNSDGKEFLEVSYHCWDFKLTDLYRRLGWRSVQRGDEAVSRLETLGYIIRVRLNPTGKQGGQSTFVFHTQKFYTITNKAKPIPGTDGKGAEHCVMLRLLHKNLKEVKKCNSVEIGKAFDGARTDLYFRLADAGYVVEAVSTTLHTEAKKLSLILLNPDVKAAFVVADKLELVKALKDELKGLEHVVPLKFSEFLNAGIEDLVNKEA